MRPINEFLLRNGLTIARNPCVSPDFCLDWPVLSARLRSGAKLTVFPKSRFETAAGSWLLLEDFGSGDCCWEFAPRQGSAALPAALRDLALDAGSRVFIPATWEVLLALKNLVQEHDPESTIFPGAAGSLGRRSLGIGARFTTLHWPAVEWAMSALELPLTANQNSIPRELVYDTDAMLQGRLDTVPFPFIGASVPEGHQGQSVEGMSHGCVLSKLRTGFHRRRIPWSFNADHQPIGGRFDAREDALVRGCLLASYITFDLSPELSLDQPARIGDIDPALVRHVRQRTVRAGFDSDPAGFERLLCSVWPAIRKMKIRDDKYRAARAAAFSTDAGRRFLRELSIDELPGLTPPETTAAMLALCNTLEMRVDFVAPAFGFQKNFPFPDNARLREMVQAQMRVCETFGASIGFHSGSGKSAENYRVIGQATGGNLEIKTSGRYTYEMGAALSESRNASDQALWRDWYTFTLEMAVAGAFAADETERNLARSFINDALGKAGRNPAGGDVFQSAATCREALSGLPRSADHMFFFEYNFLFVLAAGGRSEKAALGHHGPAGYTQRTRFYAISPEARLLYARRVAAYIVFLAESTGLVPAERCAAARALLERYSTHAGMIDDISK